MFTAERVIAGVRTASEKQKTLGVFALTNKNQGLKGWGSSRETVGHKKNKGENKNEVPNER